MNPPLLKLCGHCSPGVLARPFRSGVRRAAMFCLLLGLALPMHAADARDDFFESKIRPVFVKHCYECHSATSEKLKGGLRMDSRAALLKGGDSGPALVPGDPAKSLLLRVVRHEEKDLEMPAKKPKLPDAVITDLEQWVKQGAAFPSGVATPADKPHWAFQPVRNPPRPVVKSPWPRTSVDDFVFAKLRAQGASPAAAADKRTLLRRATYDLIGLPPTAAEADAFANDPSREAFAKAVDRLLASPQYGERWGRHWLDLVRYADTAGETADYPVPVAWRYRNWVIDAFNADKPYDEFLREQIAGDILARRGPRELYAGRVTATGYLAISRRFGFDSENYHHLTIQDSIDTLGQTVLGLSLGCARCHTHKFDPVSVNEYYGLYGIFESTRYAFPGSEQKTKSRAMVPLVPPEESQPKWREFDARLARQGGSPAMLRSVDDLDGDFEMQAPAAGGSKGVLVPPWVYDGPISVTGDAQSPFKNLYALGRVGASVPAGTNGYRLVQSVHPGWKRGGGVLHANLDFRVGGNGKDGSHRFWIGARSSSPAVEIFISSGSLALRVGESMETIRPLKPGQWQNLQLTLDLKARTVSGTVGVPGDVVTFVGRPFLAAWNGTMDFMALDAPGQTNGAMPGLAVDNLGLQAAPIAPVSTTPTIIATTTNGPDPAPLTRQLQQLVGIDGDFELQKDKSPPALPWGPGPNSVVKISAGSQSPYRNIHPAGELGIHLPNSGAYNGFGQTLTNLWKADRTGRLHASFEFRCVSGAAGGGGSWRYYLGHGSGGSPAIELFFNSSQFFRRSGNARDLVRPLQFGEWYQVRLELNLKDKTYSGSVGTAVDRTEFGGECANGWDGGIDYTFIDSYGHLPGVKPALDADNFFIGEAPPAPPGQVAAGERQSRRAKVVALRGQLAAMSGGGDQARQELNAMLIDGPFELAYAVGEGTPRNTRIQLRGEPDKLGNEVPRGFLEILGGGRLPDETSGSGRLELAEWLTRPANPLTGRVMVNRIWQHHLGQGLVKTPNDFGTRGQPPTHPELLDHLATQFVKSGWSVKAMHRLVMLSATYQQASVPSAQSSVLSPQPAAGQGRAASLSTDELTTEHFSPFPRRRLSAEETRDTILLVSGELDPKPGRGHPFPAPTGWGYSQHNPFSAVYDHNQRSVYLMTQRLKRHPFLALFDGADPNASTAARLTTTVPTQALFFLNDPFVHAKAEKFAARVQGAGTDEAQRIIAAYRLALGRSPTEPERADAAEFLAACRAELGATGKNNNDSAVLAAFARVLFGSNEFLHVD